MLVLSNFFFCHYVFKKPSAADASESVYMRERVNSNTISKCWICVCVLIHTIMNPFPHTKNPQQTTFKTSRQKNGIFLFNLFPHIDTFWRLCSRRLFENIVTKEEIARFVQFLLLLLCFQKAVCCRGVRQHLYEGNG